MERLWLIIAIVLTVAMVVSFVLTRTTRDELASGLLLAFGIGAFVGAVCTWSAAGYWGISLAILWVAAILGILMSNHASSRAGRTSVR